MAGGFSHKQNELMGFATTFVIKTQYIREYQQEHVQLKAIMMVIGRLAMNNLKIEKKKIKHS